MFSLCTFIRIYYTVRIFVLMYRRIFVMFRKHWDIKWRIALKQQDRHAKPNVFEWMWINPIYLLTRRHRNAELQLFKVVCLICPRSYTPLRIQNGAILAVSRWNGTFQGQSPLPGATLPSAQRALWWTRFAELVRYTGKAHISSAFRFFRPVSSSDWESGAADLFLATFAHELETVAGS